MNKCITILTAESESEGECTAMNFLGSPTEEIHVEVNNSTNTVDSYMQFCRKIVNGDNKLHRYVNLQGQQEDNVA